MLCDDGPVEVDEYLGFGAHHPLPLCLSKQGVAVYAPVEHALLILEHQLELLHEQLALQLVLLVLHAIQVLDLYVLGQLLHEVAVQAVHVYGQPDDLMYVDGDEAHTVLHQVRHLEEVRGDQDGDGILDLQLRILLVDVAHQPVEDVDVAVHRDVYVLQILVIREVLLEILHIRHKDRPVALEVLIPLLGLITHMDDDLIARVADGDASGGHSGGGADGPEEVRGISPKLLCVGC